MAENVKVPPLDEAPVTVVGSTPQSVFPFDFPFWEADDLIVYIDGLELAPSAFTVQGYYVQNGDPVEGGYGSGAVTLNTAVSNCSVTIDRLVVASRESQFSRAAPLGMPSLNSDLNKLTARHQDLVRILARALLAPVGENVPSAQDVIDAATAISTRMLTSGANVSNPDTFKSNAQIVPFKPGPAPVTGSRFGADWVMQVGADDGSFQGGQWTGRTNAGTIVSKSFTTTNTNVTTEVPLPGFLSTVFVDGVGYNGDGVAVMGIATAKQTGDTVFGANFIAAGATGKTNNKLVGLELDVQFPPGSTAGEGSSGLYINTFGATDTGDAIQINAHNGNWANGIKVGGINPTIGAGISAVIGQTIGSLVNTRSGNYGGVAIELGDTESRGIRIQGPVGDNSDAAQIFNSGGFLIIRGGNQPIVFQRHDTTNTLLIESGGSLDLTAASTVYKAQGTQVVSARKTGWAADTGTAKRTANATYSGTAEAAYTQATIQALMNAVRDQSQALKALKDDLISHGLIGT